MQATARPVRIVSGGQTGVDRAALDAAIACGVEHGGWCPAGRRAEDGTIPARYALEETGSADYRERTEWNVRDSDATLILTRGRPEGGTRLTLDFARQWERPCMVVDLGDFPDVDGIRQWLARSGVRVLNVAGPRESKAPGIAGEARDVLRNVMCRTLPE